MYGFKSNYIHFKENTSHYKTYDYGVIFGLEQHINHTDYLDIFLYNLLEISYFIVRFLENATIIITSIIIATMCAFITFLILSIIIWYLILFYPQFIIFIITCIYYRY